MSSNNNGEERPAQGITERLCGEKGIGDIPPASKRELLALAADVRGYLVVTAVPSPSTDLCVDPGPLSKPCTANHKVTIKV